MIEVNWLAIFLSAFAPLLFGYFWYSSPIFKSINGFEWQNRKHNPWVYLVCYIMGIPLALVMTGILSFHDVSDQHAFHGFFHGMMLGLFIVLPVFLVHFLFEADRSIRNIIYHILYWVISLGIIGLIIFAWK